MFTTSITFVHFDPKIDMQGSKTFLARKPMQNAIVRLCFNLRDAFLSSNYEEMLAN